MKLLPPREVETRTQASRNAESQRIAAISSQLSREELALNNWNDGIEKKKAQAIKDFDDKVMVLNRTIRDLEEEVSELEEKREILLRPLDDTKEKITQNLAVAEKTLAYLENRKKELAEAKDKVSLSQKQLDKKLIALEDKEIKLGNRELAVEKWEVQIKNQQLELSKASDSFTEDANRRNIELMLFQNKLKKYEIELVTRERIVAEDKEKIVADRLRIESQQSTLIAAMEEIKNKT